MENKAEQTQEEFKQKCLFESGVAYSAGAVLVMAVSFFFTIICSFAVKFPADEAGNLYYPDWYLYLSYLFPQLALGGAAALYFIRSKEGVSAVLAPCKWYYFPIAVALLLGLLFPFNELNNLLTDGLVAAGYKNSAIDMVNLSGWNLLPAILVIALLPAVIEETIFRGIIARNLYRSEWGVLATALITGALFSIYHTNPVQTVYQFVAGAALAFVAVRAGSMLPTATAHFANNALILIITALEQSGHIMGNGAFLAVLVISCVLVVLSLVFLSLFRREEMKKGKPHNAKGFLFSASVGVAVCVIAWLTVLISGFVA